MRLAYKGSQVSGTALGSFSVAICYYYGCKWLWLLAVSAQYSGPNEGRKPTDVRPGLALPLRFATEKLRVHAPSFVTVISLRMHA